MTDERKTIFNPMLIEDIVYDNWGRRDVDPLKRCVPISSVASLDWPRRQLHGMECFTINGCPHDTPNAQRRMVIAAPNRKKAEEFALANGMVGIDHEG